MHSFTSGQEFMLSINFIIACCLCIGLTLVCAAMSYKKKQIIAFQCQKYFCSFLVLMGSYGTPYLPYDIYFLYL